MTSPTTRANSMLAIAALAATIFTTVQCGGSSPSSPTTTGAVATVSLNASSVSAGGTSQGTVTLASAAPSGGSNVSLASSNAAVATVPASVTVAAGATSATFTVTAVAAGSATITASLNGTSAQSPALTVTARLVVTAISLASTSIVGGSQVSGSVSLSGAAPAGGAAVALAAGDPLVVPATVTVPAGSTSGTFVVESRSVGGSTPATITATYGGGSASVVLTVTRPTVATASFGVTGPTETETCVMTNGGNTINCTFNGSTSTAPGNIVKWDWTYGVAKTFSQTTTGPVLSMPAADCSLMPSALPAGSTWFPLTVTLVVHDDQGNVSAVKTDAGARLFPQGTCGF